MRRLVLTCAVAAAALPSCSVQAQALSSRDPCELLYVAAVYWQAERQRGVTDVQMIARINKVWLPRAVQLQIDPFWWGVLSAGPVFAYTQDAEATPHEVGESARKACWRLYT